MSPEAKDKLDVALQHVKSNRRDVLRRLLVVGGSAIALQAPMATLVAAGKSNADILKCFKKANAGYNNSITATVTGKGVVTLTGEVTDASTRAYIVDNAQNCGATKVKDQIKLVAKLGKPKNGGEGVKAKFN
jgi:osmotically-inducible protein OsmY